MSIDVKVYDDDKFSSYELLYETLKEIEKELKDSFDSEREYVRKLKLTKKDCLEFNLRTCYINPELYGGAKEGALNYFWGKCDALGVSSLFLEFFEKGKWESFDNYVGEWEKRVLSLEKEIELFKCFFQRFRKKGVVAPVEDIALLYNFLMKYSSRIDEWQLSRILGMAIVFNSQYANGNPKHNIKKIDIINELANGYNPDGSLKVTGYPCEQFDDIFGICRCSETNFMNNSFVCQLARLLWPDSQIDYSAYNMAYDLAVSSWENTIEDAYVLNGAPLLEGKCSSLSLNFFEQVLALIKTDYKTHFEFWEPYITTIKKVITLGSKAITDVTPSILQDAASEQAVTKLRDEIVSFPDDLRILCLNAIQGDVFAIQKLSEILDDYCSKLKKIQYRNYAYASCFGTNGFVKPIRNFKEFFVYLASNPYLNEEHITRMLGLAIKFNAKYAKEHPEVSIENIEIITQLAKFLTDKGSFDVMAGDCAPVVGEVNIADLLAEISVNKGSVDNRSSEFRTLLSSLLGDVFDDVPERDYVNSWIGKKLNLNTLALTFVQVYDWDSYYTYGVSVNSKDKEKTQDPEKGKYEYKKGPRDIFSEHFSPSTCELRCLPIGSCFDLMNNPVMVGLPESDFKRCKASVKNKLISEGYGGGLAYYLDFKSRELYRVALELGKSFKSIDGSNDGRVGGNFDWRAYANLDESAVVLDADVASIDVSVNCLSSFDFTSSQISTTLAERKHISFCMDELEEFYRTCRDAGEDEELFVMAIDSAVEYLSKIETFLSEKGISYNETKGKNRVLSN